MTTQQLIPLIAILIFLPLILLRNRKPRTLRLKWMWVTPALIVPLMGLALWGSSMDPRMPHIAFDTLAWVMVAVGLVLGGVFGWWRGKMTTIEKHADGTLKAQASPIGLILIIAVMLGRRALTAFLEPHAAEYGLNPLAITDAFLVFVVGMIVVQRIEMFIRARRIQAGGGDGHVEVA
ncbi:undecaprenyl pyrophosphate phosphatase UppP [Brevundimonas alba]|uniref:Undecaprenyl pyrophosphate phosphatase UppP n=1 Tax=Brevundimonas alba TaxID=74314 RepID=A0A7X5YKA8_9CAUL|nr:CcdC protein domain-containing protein [Brevundimonas alba]NJC41234.1 undecaprenyl pyrophosphate phosphatase UppP [Brevundimonas alba]